LKQLLIIVVMIAFMGAAGWLLTRNEGAQSPAAGGPRRPETALDVVAEPVQRQRIAESIEALGTARANESVTLTANLTDTVRRINFQDGDYVESGAVLVELTNEEEQAQLAEAQANLEDRRRQLKRLEDLGKRGIAATSDVDEARAAAEAAQARLNTVLARLRDRVIRAPFSGLLGFREVSTGTLVTPGTTIATLDDIAEIKLDFTLPETALGLLRAGGAIYARSAAWGDREFEGVIQTVGSRVDPVTRAATVRAIIPNQDRLLRPGMLLTVRIRGQERDALVAPEKAIVQSGAESFVFTIDGESRARRQSVILGLRQFGSVEVVAGLREGDMVITEGIIKIREGSPVRVTTPDGSVAPAVVPEGT
jgi:membrane fusion protein (multidrug efflux system)